MATQTQRSNGSGRETRIAALNIGLVRDRALRVTDSANGIARIAEAVSDGADVQIRALDEAVSGVNQMAASLKETASQAESVGTSTEQLVSSVNELSVSLEQVSANMAGLASAADQTATSATETSASIQSVRGTTEGMTAAAQQVSTSITQRSVMIRCTTPRPVRGSEHWLKIFGAPPLDA